MAFKRNREPANPWPMWKPSGVRRHCHGERAERLGKANWECWSRRDSIAGTAGWGLHDSGRKNFTHRIERRIAKRELYEAVRMEA
jgi:hypothetical protein